MSDRHERARAEAGRRYPSGADTAQTRRGAFRAGVEWADANPQPLPRPGGGCQCRGYLQHAGGGYFEHLVEYEPACPEHSEHVYNPRTGVWEHANQQPRTITRKELNTAMLRAPRGSGGAGVLAQLGIEVEDSDE